MYIVTLDRKRVGSRKSCHTETHGPFEHFLDAQRYADSLAALWAEEKGKAKVLRLDRPMAALIERAA